MGELTLVDIAIASNSAVVIVFVIWFISSKISERKIKADQEERERQLETLLKHSQEQFDNAMKIVQETNSKFFSIQQENIKYQSALNETLARLDIKIDFLSKQNN